ncbi:hypothetical protein K470DRAFT_12376 [Piedraia hortae CBS 480.64]|uniref:Uncharacterized protein n=1 Tax=Piedraia hortae CBS 480.64 TaxID=1314780 RepID=A0A6A7BR94_9PEZI|nr:hypothetical protein K470DRAFT_12376 [Piedraia hortae CBS 480.64]
MFTGSCTSCMTNQHHNLALLQNYVLAIPRNQTEKWFESNGFSIQSRSDRYLAVPVSSLAGTLNVQHLCNRECGKQWVANAYRCERLPFSRHKWVHADGGASDRWVINEHILRHHRGILAPS